MDKWLESSWFVRVVALSLATLLFLTVNFESESSTIRFNTPSMKDSETVEAVPVEVYYDQENVVVSGIPKTVDVTLSGPKNILIPAAKSRDFTVVVDLSEASLGTQTVKFEMEDLSDKLSYTIAPSSAEVTIEEKVTKEFTVQPEYDRSLLTDGYLAKEPIINPETVSITGGKEMIEKIAYVKAIINVKETAKGAVEINAPIEVLDSELNKLDVNVETDYVKVQLDIQSPSKEVKISPVESGKTPEGIEIENMIPEPSSITIYGKRSVLDTINELQIPVDVSNLTKDTILTVSIDLPEGVQSASEEEVKLSIKVNNTITDGETPETEEEEENQTSTEPKDEMEENEETEEASKTFGNVQIDQEGLEDGYELEFISPKNGSVDVSVTGKQSLIRDMQANDIQLTLNVSNLEEGEHTASIQVDSPEGIKVQPTETNAKFMITKISGETDETVGFNRIDRFKQEIMHYYG
ncbi:MAG: YbbR-like domain-containing protein [Bacillus sp. (in: firmicutes)]